MLVPGIEGHLMEAEIQQNSESPWGKAFTIVNGGYHYKNI